MRYVSVNGVVTAEFPHLTIQRPHTLATRTGLPTIYTIELNRITSVALLPNTPVGWASLSVAVDGAPVPLPAAAALSADPATIIFAAEELPAFQALAHWLQHVVQVNRAAASTPNDPATISSSDMSSAADQTHTLDNRTPSIAMSAEHTLDLPAEVEAKHEQVNTDVWEQDDDIRETWAQILRSREQFQLLVACTARPLIRIPLYEALIARDLRFCLGVLADLPKRKPWPRDDDTERAQRAAERVRRREAEEERLALEPSASADAVRDRIDQWVLLSGTYKQGPPGALYERGVIRSGARTYTVLDVPPRYDGMEVWVIASPRPERDVFVAEVLGRLSPDQMLPRWPGMTPAMCVARAIFVSHLLVRARDRLPAENALLIDRLAALHTPQTSRDLELLEELGSEEGEAVADWLVDCAEYGLPEADEPPAMPAPRMVKGHEAAEEYAAEVLAALGFGGVRRTPTGADGGIDVIGDDVVAQVKMEALPAGRDRIQALAGIARVEDAHAVFFTLAGYSAPAIAWADRAGIALLEFETDGSISAANQVGRLLLDEGAAGLR